MGGRAAIVDARPGLGDAMRHHASTRRARDVVDPSADHGADERSGGVEDTRAARSLEGVRIEREVVERIAACVDDTGAAVDLQRQAAAGADDHQRVTGLDRRRANRDGAAIHRHAIELHERVVEPFGRAVGDQRARDHAAAGEDVGRRERLLSTIGAASVVEHEGELAARGGGAEAMAGRDDDVTFDQHRRADGRRRLVREALAAANAEFVGQARRLDAHAAEDRAPQVRRRYDRRDARLRQPTERGIGVVAHVAAIVVAVEDALAPHADVLVQTRRRHRAPGGEHQQRPDRARTETRSQAKKEHPGAPALR
jgi:hypothetical protein